MLYLVLPLKFYCKARVGQCTRAWPTMSVYSAVHDSARGELLPKGKAF